MTIELCALESIDVLFSKRVHVIKFFREVSVLFLSLCFSMFLIFIFPECVLRQTLGTMSDFKCGEEVRKERKKEYKGF